MNVILSWRTLSWALWKLFNQTAAASLDMRSFIKLNIRKFTSLYEDFPSNLAVLAVYLPAQVVWGL
jgi:hypothetical protein